MLYTNNLLNSIVGGYMTNMQELPVWSRFDRHNPEPGPYLDSEGTRVSARMVLESAAGFYIGRTCPQGPYSRESVEYFPERGLAEQALEDGSFTFRSSP